MNPNQTNKKTRAAAAWSLLLVLGGLPAFAQQVSPTPKEGAEPEKKEEVVNLGTFTVTTGYRSPKALDQIPGAIKLISSDEVSNTQLLTEDATAVLARTIPGYTPGTQQMQNTGETLRGRVALRLFDGISQTTPLREGGRNATFTDMGVVDRIEVINGPSATEGIGAVGGIINYISKSPTKEGSEATLRSKFYGQGYDDSYGWSVGLNYMNKRGPSDIFVGVETGERGMGFDANGRRLGLGASGSLNDTRSNNVFLKAGRSFGENNAQRVTLTASRFHIEGQSHYVPLLGDRARGITDSSIRGVPPGARASFNDFDQYALAYKNDALFGGSLNVQAYKASQAMRFVPEVVSADKADPVLAPLGVGIDQSEINSQKKGMRSSWSGRDLFGIAGLELTPGFDFLDEVAQQRLALTGRTWVPPMNYISKAPFAQASYTQGPITVSAGVRHEGGELKVDDYTTVFFANNTPVKGGTLKYSETLPNVGLIARLPQNWSIFGSYSKGFTLPNVGIPLRNVNTPGQSVDGIVDLQAVVADNKEGGISWRGKNFSFSGSYYRSYSELGASLSVDPVTKDFILQRRPVLLKGYELTGEYRPNKQLKFTALYSHIKGLTRTTETGPLSRVQGISNVSPDKLNLSTTWKFMPKASATLDVEHVFARDINVGAAGEEHTTSLTLAHLTATYSTPWGDFSIGIENLMNKYYILPWAQIDQFQNYFAGRGRVISLSHTIKF